MTRDPRDADWATLLRMDGDPEGPVEHDTQRRQPCPSCATMRLDYHETYCEGNA